MRILYTDGSQGANNLKAGGWAFLEVADGKIVFEKYDADFSFGVTSNQMELRAAIEAAKTLNPGENATIHSDSQYVLKGITEWIVGWQKRNWKTSKKEPVINKELWLELLEAVNDKAIEWVWVRSHNNDEFNERVDELAKFIYTKPEKIMSIALSKPAIKKILSKPSVGSIIHFGDPSKRYIVMINEVKVGDSFGFMAKLLANNLGNELEFFSYDKNQISLVEEKSDKELRTVFKTMERFKENISEEVYKLIKNCNHKIKKHGESAICFICEDDFGWFCPESKDSCCHYYSNDGKVQLRNGELVDVPPDHDEDYETYDCCIFCGAPDERK